MKTPDRWLELVLQPYPSGTATTVRWAETAMGFPTMVEGRVLSGAWSDIEHALSDWKGSPEASVANIDVNDADGAVRAIIAALGVTTYARVEATIKWLSEAGRKAGLLPRIVHRGFLAATPQPKGRRKATVSVVDVTGSHFYNLNPEALLQKIVWSREFLAFAGLTNTPKNTLSQPLNIVLGEHSDAGATDRAGNTAEKGMIPPDDIGDMVISSSNVVVTDSESIEIIPAPVLTAEVIGTPGSKTYSYQVSMLTATGETAGSNIVTITNAPDTLDASNYVRLTWAAPDGWADVYTANAIAFRVFGRTTNPPTKYLDLMNNGGTFVSPEYEYHDDQDHDIEKDPGPLSVGTAVITLIAPGDPTTVTTSTAYGVMVYSAGYAPLQKVFGSNLSQGAVPGRTDITDQVITPDSAAWPFANRWIELAHPDGGTVRVSAFLVNGPLLNQARSGSVTFAVTTCGMLDTGDDTGAPITEASVGYAFVLNEFMLKNNGQGYRTGAHWPLEQFSNGETVLNTAVLNAFRDKGIKFLGGTGFRFHFAATQPVTLSQFQQAFNNTFTCFTGSLDNGQEGVWVIDPDTDTTGSATFRRHIELPVWLPDTQVVDEEVENRLWFVYDYDPDADAYRGDPELVQDVPSQQLYGIRDVVPQTGATIAPLEMRCTRDQATARDAAGRRIFLNKVAPVYQALPTTLLGLETALGDVIRVTHVDGLDTNGYVDHPFFVVRKRLLSSRPNLGVLLTARDISRMVSRSDMLTDSATDAGATLPFVMG